MTEEIIPIYSGRPEDFHWGGFGSGSGTNLRECARRVKSPSLIVCNRPSAELLTLEELRDVPRIVIDSYEFCGSWRKARRNPLAKAEYKRKSILYDQELLNRIRRFERDSEIKINLFVLGGYMRFVLDPLLEAFEDKMINVHPAKLYELRDGKRVYVGGDAVYDAILAGERTTRSSVIIVDKEEDHGEILTTGPELEVWHEFLGGTPTERQICQRGYIDAHQNFQKARSDWPVLTFTLKAISESRFALGTERSHFGEWRTVYFDGEPLPYMGYQLSD